MMNKMSMLKDAMKKTVNANANFMNEVVTLYTNGNDNLFSLVSAVIGFQTAQVEALVVMERETLNAKEFLDSAAKINQAWQKLSNQATCYELNKTLTSSMLSVSMEYLACKLCLDDITETICAMARNQNV